MESLPKTIARRPTRSLDENLPYIAELMKYGQITIANVRPVGCVAVAHDGRQTVSMLRRREREAGALTNHFRCRLRMYFRFLVLDPLSLELHQGTPERLDCVVNVHDVFGTPF